MDVAKVGAPEGKKVTWSLLRNELLRSLLCSLFALPFGCDKLIFHEIEEGQSWRLRSWNMLCAGAVGRHAEGAEMHFCV